MSRESGQSPGPFLSDAARFWLILAAAALVRLWQLDWQSLTLDEAMSLHLARGRPLGRVLFDNSDNTPPLYYLALRLWTTAFGNSEAALRAPSAIAGTLAVAFTGWAGRTLGSMALGNAAMILMALLPMPVIFSQTARSYALFLSASTASFACLLAWERRRDRRLAAAYLASTLTMCYTHNYWVFNVAAQQIYLCWSAYRGRIRPSAWLKLSAGLLAGYLPLLPWFVHRATLLRQDGSWIPPAGGRVLMSSIRSHFISSLPPSAALPYLVLVALGLVVSLGLGGKLLRRRAKTPAPNAPGWGLVALWALCPILLPLLCSRLSTPILWPRYTLAASPAFCLLIARGVLLLPPGWPAAAALGSLSLLSAFSLSRNLSRQQEDWRAAAARLNAMSSGTDVIITCESYVDVPLFYYYRGKAPLVPLPAAAPEAEAPAAAEKIDKTLAGHRRAWVLMRQEARHLGRRLLPDIILERRKDARLVYAEDFGQGVYLLAIALGG